MKQKHLPYIGIDDTRIMLAGIPFVGLFILVFINGMNPFQYPDKFLLHWLSSSLYTGYYWVFNRLLIIYFRKKYPQAEQTNKRLVLQLLAIVAFTGVSCFALDRLPLWLFNINMQQATHTSPYQLLNTSMMITLAIAAIYEIIFIVYRWNQTLVEAQALKQAQLLSQLESLKSQINPHFLFNSLNTLVSIIPEQPATATEFVQHLSKVYRYILEMKERQLISLKQELDFIRSYIFLLQIRFPTNLVIHIRIEAQDERALLIPLALQPLIENAIKHNIISQSHPLHLSIYCNEGYVCVKNNLQLRSTPESGTGTGLSNLIERCKLSLNRDIIIRNDGHFFEVKLPIQYPQA